MSTPSVTPLFDDERRGWTSASNAAADILCQHRHTMQSGCEKLPSPAASFGDRIHAALAINSPAGLTDVAEIQTYEACVDIREKKVEEFFGSDLTGMTCWNERRFWVKFSSARPGVRLEHSGKADRTCMKIGGDKVLIFDYKSLAGDTPPSDVNEQVRDLAAMVGKEFMAELVGVCIIQPMVTHSPPITVYDKAALRRALQALYARVDNSNFPQTPEPTPGETQCEFCLAKSKCKPYNRWAGALLPAMLDLLQVPVADWAPAQRAIFCERFRPAKKWLFGTLTEIKDGIAKDPNFAPGFGLTSGQRRRPIVKPQVVFDRFVAAGGTPSAFLACVKVAKGDLKQATHDATKLKGKNLTNKLDELTEGATDDRMTAPSLMKIETQESVEEDQP